MAEAIARAEAQTLGLTKLEFRSAGVFASAGAPASEGARFVAQRHGLSLETHTASPVTSEVLQWADVILTMGWSHLQALEPGDIGLRDPGTSTGATLLGTVASRGLVPAGGGDPQVPDPFGGSHDVYEETWNTLASMVRRALVVLTEGESEDG
jgi:protein-tyrosine phosphatase